MINTHSALSTTGFSTTGTPEGPIASLSQVGDPNLSSAEPATASPATASPATASLISDGTSEIDALLAATLSPDDLAAIIKDPDSPPEMFAFAADKIISKLIAKQCRTYLDYNQAAVVGKILNDPRAKLGPVAARLARHTLALATNTNYQFRIAISDLYRQAELPVSLLTEMLRPDLEAWRTARLAVLTNLFAYRAKALHESNSEGNRSEVDKIVSLIEGVFLDERAIREQWKDDTPAEQLTRMISRHLMTLLNELSPVLSLPLLDRLISLRHANWPTQVLAYIERPDIYDERRIDTLFTLKFLPVDSRLVSNPNVTSSRLWAVYARYAKDNPRLAGQLLASVPEVSTFLERTAFGLALKGVVERRAGKPPGDGQPAPPQSTPHQSAPADPTAPTAPSPGTDISDRMLRAAYESCLSDPCDQDTTVAALAYARFGEEAGEALVKLKRDPIAVALFHQWERDPKEDLLLHALLAYPRKGVRHTMLVEPFKSRFGGVDLAAVTRMAPEAKRLYRDLILPRFAQDRAEEVRSLAMSAFVVLARDGEAEKEFAIRHGMLSDLAQLASHKGQLAPEHFDMLLARGSAAVSFDHTRLLLTLAERKDLTLDQYKALAASGIDAVTAKVIASVGESFDGVKSFLMSLRTVGMETRKELARRAEWDQYERAFYLRHQDHEVRRALAGASQALTIKEVITLLGDSNAEARKALLDNPCWPRYALMLEQLIDEGSRTPAPGMN